MGRHTVAQTMQVRRMAQLQWDSQPKIMGIHGCASQMRTMVLEYLPTHKKWPSHVGKIDVNSAAPWFASGYGSNTK